MSTFWRPWLQEKPIKQQLSKEAKDKINHIYKELSFKKGEIDAFEEIMRLTNLSLALLYSILNEGTNKRKVRIDKGYFRKIGKSNLETARKIVKKLFDNDDNPTIAKVQSALKRENIVCSKMTVSRFLKSNGFVLRRYRSGRDKN